MKQADKLFGNFFDSSHITPRRLGNFASKVIERLTAANDTGEFTGLINQLYAVRRAFVKEHGAIVFAVNDFDSAQFTGVDNNIYFRNNVVSLGDTLAAIAHSFEWAFTKSAAVKQQPMEAAADNRSQSRTALELALLSAIFRIAATYQGNVEKCNSFFCFNLLFATGNVKNIGEMGMIVLPA